MFNVGAWELTLVLIAALLLLGPQKLPEFARWIGKALHEIRNVTQDVRSAIDLEMEKQELNNLKEDLTNTTQNLIEDISPWEKLNISNTDLNEPEEENSSTESDPNETNTSTTKEDNKPQNDEPLETQSNDDNQPLETQSNDDNQHNESPNNIEENQPIANVPRDLSSMIEPIEPSQKTQEPPNNPTKEPTDP